jgi:uncharacterized membrane protein (UPF0136 family)
MVLEATESTEPTDPLRKALTHGLAFWAVATPLWILGGSALKGTLALDFHGAFMPASRAVLHGVSPYSAIGSHALAVGKGFLYPPLTGYLLAPFTVLPPLAAEIVAVVLVAGTVPLILLVLGVRDWRCHAMAFLWWPTIVGIQTANLTLPMLLGVAGLWRYRDRKIVATLITGLVVALKLFFWPVLFWLVATRRYRTAGLAAVSSALLVVVPWAGIRFAGLRGYPHLLSSVSSHEGPRSYSLAALLNAVLPSWTAAIAVETLVGAALLVVVFVAARRGRERDAFALSIVAILVLSPLLEIHYLAALLVVVALYEKRFSLAWTVPLLFYGAHATVAQSAFQVVHVLAVVVATTALVLWHWRPQALVRVLHSGSRSGPPPPSHPLHSTH